MTTFGGAVARHIATCTGASCLFCAALRVETPEDDER